MKLQLALDTFALDAALDVARRVRDYVDILEMGTPFLMEYGMEAVRRFRNAFPEKHILADAKIMDAGRLEVATALRAGADTVTVLAATDRMTMAECVTEAARRGGRIVADMICVEDIPGKVRELEALGVHGIAVHTGVDQQKAGRTPLEDLRIIKDCSTCAEVSVAGGISLGTVTDYIALKPDVLIVGGAIAAAPDPAEAARGIYEAIKKGMTKWDS